MHEFNKYKPSYTIFIPKDFEGCAYLFTTPEQRSDVYLNESGIGYIGSHGKAEWKIKKGNKDITDAYASIQYNEILLYSSDSTNMTVYDVMCININNSNQYPKRCCDFVVAPCMDNIEFLHIKKSGTVQEIRLRKRTWNDSSKRKDWIFDKIRSRI